MARVDEGFAVALNNGSIVVCNNEGDEVATHTSASHPTQCLASAMDRLFCASYGRVEIRNLPSGEILDSIPIRQAKLEAIAASPDATQLAVAGESVHVWDLHKRRVVLETPLEYWNHLCVAFSHDGRYVAAGGTHLSIWDIARNQQVLHLARRTDAAAFSDDGRLLIFGGLDSGLHVMETSSWKATRVYDGDVRRISVDQDGKWCAFGAWNNLGVVNLTTLTVHRREYSIRSASFIGSTDVAAICSDGCLREWSLPRATLKAESVESGEHFTTTKSLAALSTEECTSVWNLDTSERRHQLRGIAAIVSYSESQVLTKSRNSLHCYCAKKGNLIWEREFDGPISTMRFSTSSHLAAVAFKTRVRFVSSLNGEIVPPYELIHEYNVVSLGFSKDGKRLAVGHQSNGISIWAIDEGFRLVSELRFDTWPTSIQFDDFLLVGTLEGELLVYNSESFQLLDRRQVHQWRIHQLSLSEDGCSCLTSSYDGTSVIVPLPGQNSIGDTPPLPGG